MVLNKLLDKNAPYLFFIKFLLCFFILYFFFPFYWGITGAGGRIYSPFLDHHFNIIRWLTSFLTGSARLFLEALHYSVYQKDYHSLRIGYGGGVNVNPSCLGWGVMSFWVAFVYANMGGWKHKLKWTIIGIASICILNITRITLIALAIHLRWHTITALDHHQTFNIFSYGCIFILMYWYTRVQKQYEGTRYKQKKQTLPV
jgi:exosortase/archaeosortase family protein